MYACRLAAGTTAPPAVAGGSGTPPSRLRRLAGATAATVTAQVLNEGNFNVLSMSRQIPSTCTGGGACGNANGNNNVQIVDPGVEFGYDETPALFASGNRLDADVTAG
jgi:hypothetical protein